MQKRVITVFLLATVLVLSNRSHAQLNCPSPTGQQKADKFHLTVSGGPTFLYGDKNSANTRGAAVQGKLDFRIIKGLLVGVEAQTGTLDATPWDSDQRSVRNAYSMGAVNVTVYPAHFFTEIARNYNPSFGEKLVNGLYLGVGAGGTYNFYRDIDYDNTDDESYYPRGSKTKSLLLPVTNLGVSIPLSNPYRGFRTGYWSIVVNGQFAFSDDDDLDGLNPTSEEANKNKDMYSLYSAGLRFSF